MAVVVGAGFGSGVDVHGSGPEFLGSDAGEVDCGCAVHAGGLRCVVVQRVGGDYADTGGLPVVGLGGWSMVTASEEVGGLLEDVHGHVHDGDDLRPTCRLYVVFSILRIGVGFKCFWVLFLEGVVVIMETNGKTDEVSRKVGLR